MLEFSHLIFFAYFTFEVKNFICDVLKISFNNVFLYSMFEFSHSIFLAYFMFEVKNFICDVVKIFHSITELWEGEETTALIG